MKSEKAVQWWVTANRSATRAMPANRCSGRCATSLWCLHRARQRPRGTRLFDADVGAARRRVQTIEGLAPSAATLHPVQQASIGSGGALVLEAASGSDASGTPIGPFVRIEPDNRAVIGCRNPEIGQGVITALR